MARRATIRYPPSENTVTTLAAPKPSSKRLGITGQDSAADAARKAMRFHFRRMLKYEAGAIDGRDSEDLHDMRVAVRRLRAAVQLFRPYLPKKQVARLRKDLRRLGRALGPARDYDVMLANLDAYRAAAPATAEDALAPLVRRWRKQRKRARKAMIEYLESKRYRRLKRRMGEYLEAPRPPEVAADTADGRAAVPQDPLISAVVPALIANRYDRLLAYGPSLHSASIETLHALRIDCKRLRYALEFLREVLPAQAAEAIEDVTQAQDHLGEINDAYVAGGVLRQLVKQWRRAKDDSRNSAASRNALAVYLAYCDDCVRTKAHTFPVMWERLTGYEFRQRLQDITAPA